MNANKFRSKMEEIGTKLASLSGADTAELSAIQQTLWDVHKDVDDWVKQRATDDELEARRLIQEVGAAANVLHNDVKQTGGILKNLEDKVGENQEKAEAQ